MAEAEVGLRASLKDRRETAAGLKSVERSVDSVGRSAENAGLKAKIGARGFDAMRKSGHLAGLAIKAGFGLALTAGYATVRLLRASFDEARESQKVGARTANVIKTTGAVANITARQVGKLSTAISLKAGIDDEAIQTGANLLLTFKNIRNEAGKGNDVFNQTTQAAIDLSAAGFGSIESSSKMLGKALNDPLKGLTALGRAGVTFTADQINQIQTLVSQNKLLDAQKIILHEVNSQVGGAAAAQATWGQKAKVLWQNVEENIGTALLPLLDRTERWFVRTAGPAINGWVRDFSSKGVPAIHRFLDSATPLAEQVLPAAGTALGTVRDALATAAPYAERLVQAFNGLPKWAKEGGVAAGAAAYLGVKTGALKAVLGSRGGGGLLGAVSKSSPVPVFVTNEGFGGVGGGGGGSGKAGKFGTIAAAALGSELAVPVAAAAATIGGFFIYKKAADPDTLNTRYNNYGAPQHAPGSNPAGTATLTAPKGTYGGFDNFNDLLSAQKLASKYQFDFNTELQTTHNKIDLARTKATLFGGVLQHVAKTKVDPPITTPGLPQAQTGVNVLDTALDRVAKGATAHVRADAGQAMTVLNNLQNFAFRDKFIHVHTVQGSGAGTEQAAHGGAPRATGGTVLPHRPYIVGERRPELFVPDRAGRIFPRVDMPDVDLGAAGQSPIEANVNVYLDGRKIYSSVVDHAELQDARR